MKYAGALYSQNNNGTFTRTAENQISPRPSPQGGLVDRHACAWADVDHNGLLDMYSSAGRYASNRYKTEDINNELFLQTTVGKFTDVATQAGVGEPCTRGRHVAFADFNGDGWADLFLGAQAERSDRKDACNTAPDAPYNEQAKVFVNRGADANGTWLGFRTGPEFNVSQATTGGRMALTWDENRDGKPDLLTLAFADKTRYFYRNTGAGFTELASKGTMRLPNMNGANLGDVNGDGILDVVYGDDTGFGYLRGTATGLNLTPVRIANIGKDMEGWSTAVGDINGDGLMDVYGQVANNGGRTGGNPDDMIYLGQPGGGWQALTVPSAGGDASDVATVHVGGKAQFVVANGGNDEKATPGPIQLIAWAGTT